MAFALSNNRKLAFVSWKVIIEYYSKVDALCFFSLRINPNLFKHTRLVNQGRGMRAKMHLARSSCESAQRNTVHRPPVLRVVSGGKHTPQSFAYLARPKCVSQHQTISRSPRVPVPHDTPRTRDPSIPAALILDFRWGPAGLYRSRRSALHG